MNSPRALCVRHKRTLLAILFLGAFSLTVVYATPPTSPYQPGSTLDPSCAPGDTNCTVTIFPDQATHAGQYLTTDGTSVSWGTVVSGTTWGSITGTLSNQTDLQSALNAKQDTLVSGTNIKTVNGTSLLGSGDVVVAASQWDTVTGGINYAGGNVGINTPLPLAALHVTSPDADSSTAAAAIIDTTNSFSTTGSKLLSLQNAGTPQLYVNYDGGIHVGKDPVSVWGSANGSTLIGTRDESLGESGNELALVSVSDPSWAHYSMYDSYGSSLGWDTYFETGDTSDWAGTHIKTTSTDVIFTLYDKNHNSGLTVLNPTAADSGFVPYQFNTTNTLTTANNIFQISNAGTQLFGLLNSGALTLNKYGVGTFTGTATHALQVDASGNVIEGTVGGTTPTFEETLIQGNALTANRSIDTGTHSFQLGGTHGAYLKFQDDDTNAFTQYFDTLISYANNSYAQIVARNGDAGVYSGPAGSTGPATDSWVEANAGDVNIHGQNILIDPPSGNTTGAGYVLTDVAGDGYATWQPATGESTTASNGLTLSGSDVQLGGTLSANTTIAGGTYSFRFSNDNVYTNRISAYDNYGNGAAVSGNGNTTGTGVSASSGTGYGVFAFTSGGIPLGGRVTSSSTNTTNTILRLEGLTSGTAANGIGGSIDFYNQDSIAILLANQLISKWTDATDATRTSEFSITGVNSATTQTLLTLAGSGAAKLNKYGAGTFTGTATHSLQVDASGNVIEGAVGGASLIGSTSTGGTETVLGTSLATLGTMSTNHTISIGIGSGTNATTAAASNFIGWSAGAGATNAYDSNFIGLQAGNGATGAYESNFLGDAAGESAPSAYYSNFMGYAAGANANNAYYSNFIGYDAGDSSPNAANSIFIGSSAGFLDSVNNTANSNDFSILIGNNTSTGGFSNSIAIGAYATNTAVNQFMIGSTTRPIDSTRWNGSSSTQCTITTGTGIACTSDERLKTDVTPLPDTVLDDLLNVQTVTYHWLQNPSSPEQVGFLAQDLEHYFPDLVATDSNGYKSVYYSQMTPILTKAIQEMDIKVESIQNLTDGTTDAPNFVDNLRAWFASASNGITQFFAKEVDTKNLCVTDDSGNKTCITKSQLDHLLQMNTQVPQQSTSTPPAAPAETTSPTPPATSTDSPTPPPTDDTTLNPTDKNMDADGLKLPPPPQQVVPATTDATQPTTDTATPVPSTETTPQAPIEQAPAPGADAPADTSVVAQ